MVELPPAHLAAEMRALRVQILSVFPDSQDGAQGFLRFRNCVSIIVSIPKSYEGSQERSSSPPKTCESGRRQRANEQRTRPATITFSLLYHVWSWC